MAIIMFGCTNWTIVSTLAEIITPIISLVAVFVAIFFSRRDQKIDLIPFRVKAILFVEALHNVICVTAHCANQGNEQKKSGISIAQRFIEECKKSRVIGEILRRDEGWKEGKNCYSDITNIIYRESKLLKCYFGFKGIDNILLIIKDYLDMVVSLDPSGGWIDAKSLDNEPKIIELSDSLIAELPSFIEQMEQETWLTSKRLKSFFGRIINGTNTQKGRTK